MIDDSRHDIEISSCFRLSRPRIFVPALAWNGREALDSTRIRYGFATHVGIAGGFPFGLAHRIPKGGATVGGLSIGRLIPPYGTFKVHMRLSSGGFWAPDSIYRLALLRTKNVHLMGAFCARRLLHQGVQVGRSDVRAGTLIDG